MSEQQVGQELTFEEILPELRQRVSHYLRKIPVQFREDLELEAIGLALQLFRSLERRGQTSRATAGSLAHFARKMIFQGRALSHSRNVHDINSPYCWKEKGVRKQPMHRFDREHGIWQEVTYEDTRTPVAEQVAFRVDFPAWLSGLSQQKRQMVQALLEGLSTKEAAEQLKITAGRVSQLRRELFDGWNAYHQPQVL